MAIKLKSELLVLALVAILLSPNLAKSTSQSLDTFFFAKASKNTRDEREQETESIQNLISKKISETNTTEILGLESFKKQLDEFKPNAPWVMQELLNLQLKDFFKGLELAILMLAQSQTRADYFNEKDCDDITQLYSKSLWQCTVYEIFLKNIYLKSYNKDIDLIQVTKKIASENGLIPILDIAQQLDVPQGEHHPMFVFYAFYCDCLVNQFSEAIKYSYAHINNSELYKKYCQLAVKFNKELKKQVAKLKTWSNATYDKTKFEAIYAELYEKNQQIVSLLKKQNKQADYGD